MEIRMVSAEKREASSGLIIISLLMCLSRVCSPLIGLDVFFFLHFIWKAMKVQLILIKRYNKWRNIPNKFFSKP